MTTAYMGRLNSLVECYLKPTQENQIDAERKVIYQYSMLVTLNALFHLQNEPITLACM